MRHKWKALFDKTLNAVSKKMNGFSKVWSNTTKLKTNNVQFAHDYAEGDDLSKTLVMTFLKFDVEIEIL